MTLRMLTFLHIGFMNIWYQGRFTKLTETRIYQWNLLLIYFILLPRILTRRDCLSRLLENAFLITNTLEIHTYISFYRRLFSLIISTTKILK